MKPSTVAADGAATEAPNGTLHVKLGDAGGAAARRMVGGQGGWWSLAAVATSPRYIRVRSSYLQPSYGPGMGWQALAYFRRGAGWPGCTIGAGGERARLIRAMRHHPERAFE